MLFKIIIIITAYCNMLIIFGFENKRNPILKLVGFFFNRTTNI
jgi:hypothetical protein